MAHSHLFIERVPVGKTAVAAYVALPDGIHVVNAFFVGECIIVFVCWLAGLFIRRLCEREAGN